MKCVCIFVLVFVGQNAVFGEEDEWISIKKKDLCPALHKEAICTDNLVDFDEIARTIRKLGDKGTLSDDQSDAGHDASKCGEPLKKAFCSSDASPLCLEDKTSGDDAAERRVCQELYNTCPSIASEPSLNYMKECAQYLKREFTDMTCKTVGTDFKEGVCPKPTRKMPEFYIQVYQRQSDIMKPLRDLLDEANSVLENVWDSKCLQIVRELPCMPIYCSETDESVIQIKNKRKDCSRAMECVSKSTQRLDSLTGELAKVLVGEVRDAIKNSCETIIKGFEDLVNPTSKKSQSGGVSTLQFSLSFILLAALLSLNIMHF